MNLCKKGGEFRKYLGVICLAVIITAASFSSPAYAADLTVFPVTWNIIGLDSNRPADGPYRFPVGARICNTGGSATTVTVDFVWDDGKDDFWGDPDPDAYINLREGSLASTILSFTGNGCQDAYFEVEVARIAGAYDKTRGYHITATDASGTASTPTPRELYVEHLISQNRNGITDIRLNGASIPAGGSMTLMVGGTYTIALVGFTATQGYNQLESFINFPNTIFQVLAVSTSYSADSNLSRVPNPDDKLYADSCLWENDFNSPNYRSCIGGDDKAGGNVTVEYTVRIIGGVGTNQTLNSLFYDFSGSSFHYNADYGVGSRIANIVSPSSVTLSKNFTPKAISPGGTSVMTFRLSNPTTESFTDVNFTDSLTGGLTATATPALSYNGCGAAPSPAAVSGGATSLSFSDITLSPNSICTITLNVTAPEGVYPNTTGHLFIDGSTDTGNAGSDTLTVSSAPACVPGRTLVNWTVPVGTVANPPDSAGGVPTTKAVNIATAAASANLAGSIAITTSGGSNDTTAWSTWGYKNDGQYVQFVIDTSKYSGVSMSFYMKNDGLSVGPTSVVVSYNSGSGFTNILTINSPSDTFTLHTIDFSGLTSTIGNTTFRISASGANNDNQGAGLVFDDIKFIGCSIPAPAPTITKSFSPDPVIRGAASTLTFTIRNTAAGSSNLTGVSFTDVLPAGLSLADSSSSQCNGGILTTTASTRTIAFAGGSLNTGASCTFDVTVTGTTQGQYENITGYLSSAQSGTSTNYATDSLTVIAPPSLSKSFSPTSIFTGNTATLTFIVVNSNLSTALSNVGFTDSPLADTGGLEIADPNGLSGSCGAGTIIAVAGSTSVSLSGAALAANTSCIFSVDVKGTTAGSKNNTTSPVSSDEGGNGNPVSASIVVNDQTAVIDLNKQISDDGAAWFKFIGLPAGGNVYYRFSAYNGGDLNLTSVSVSDAQLLGLGLDPASCSWKDSSGNALLFPLVPGDTAYCVLGTAAAVSGTNENTASATGVYASGATNSSPSTAAYATTGLTMAKSAGESYFAAAGDLLHYSYQVTNSGFAPLVGPVTVADDKTAVACPATDTVGDNDNFLDPGESITCSAVYTVEAEDVTAGSVTNTATASAEGVASNTDSETVNLYAPHLTLLKTGELDMTVVNPGYSAEVGDVIDYTITAINDGNVTLTNVVISDPKLGVLTCIQPTTLAPAASLSCTGSYTLVQNDLDAHEVTNTASADNDQTSPAMATSTVSLPDLSLVKTATPHLTSPYAMTGDTIDYEIVATNNGEIGLKEVSISDPLLGTLTCTPEQPADLNVGETLSCTGSYTVTQADIDAGKVDNVAAAESTLPDDTDGPRRTAGAHVELQAGPGVHIFKSGSLDIAQIAPASRADAGDVINYSFTVENVGNVTLHDINVTDPNIASIACTGGNPIPLLAVGASTTCTGSYAITQSDIDAGSVHNTATASGADPSENPVEDTGSNDQPITGSPNLTLTKTAGQVSYDHAGEVISYTITATNEGNVTLTNVSITDAKIGMLSCIQPVTLAPGEDLACTGTYTITQADMDNGSMTNTANASGTAPDSQTVNAEDSETLNAVQSPNLMLTKTAGQVSYDHAGEVISYTITAMNDGNVTLTNVSITDAKLGTLTCVQPATLAPGDDLTCTGTYTITQADMDSGSMTNTANASGTAPDNQTVNAEDSETLDAVQSPNLTLTKTAGQVSYDHAGEVINYTITAMNDGNVTLTNVSITDVKLGTVNCIQPVTLAPGDDLTCTGSYVITQADVDSGSVTNTAGASGTAPDNQTLSAEDNETVSATYDPVLTLTKTGELDMTVMNPGYSAEVGDVINYTLTAVNDGNVTLTNVVISDPRLGVLACIQPTTLAPAASLSCTGSYTLVQNDLDAHEVTNTASADSDQTSPAMATSTVSLPDLSLVKTATPHLTSPYAMAGDTIDYEIVAVNNGETGLKAVTISDPLLGTLTCIPEQPADLNLGETLSCTGSYTVTQADIDAGKVDNVAAAESTLPDDTDGPRKTAGAHVELQAGPGVHIFKSGSLDMAQIAPASRADAGDVINYSFTVENVGNVTLHDINVTDPNIAAITCTGGNPIPLLAVGASTTCTGSYAITQSDIDAGNVHNTATASGADPSENPVEDTGSNDQPITGSPNLTLTKTAGQVSYDHAGEVISYTLTATNEGNVTLTNVSITDAKIGMLSCIQPVTLAPGEDLTCTGTYTITQADMDSGSMTNTANASGTAPDSQTVNAEDSETLNAVQSPNLTLTKTAGEVSYDHAGEVINYTITAMNEGNVTLTNVSITDAKLGTLTCAQPATLAPGDDLTCTGTYTITQADMDSGSMTNTANASGTSPDNQTVNAEDSEIIDANEIADVTTTVIAPAAAAAGSTVNVAIGFSNNGPFAAAGVTYAVSLPPGLSGVSCTGAVCSYNVSTGAITVTGLPVSLPGGQTANITLSYTAPASGNIPVAATIGTITPQGANTAPDTANDSTIITPLADVTTTASAPAAAVAGSTVNVTILFGNNGPSTALSVVYAVALPSGLSGVGCQGGGASCSYNSSTGLVTVQGLPGTLAPGQSVNITLSYTAPSGGNVSVTSTISTSTPQGANIARDSDSGATLINGAGLMATVPTMNEWGLLTFMIGASFLSYYYFRKARR